MHASDVELPRRIVTGLGADGKSYIARHEEIEAVDAGYVVPLPEASLLPGYDFQRDHPYRGGYYRVWASDQLPFPLPSTGRMPTIDNDPTPEETPQLLRVAAACPPELGMRAAWGRYADVGGPGGMHWHDTVEIRFVMSGARGQITDSGEEFVWQTGDVMIQNGTNHSHYQFNEEPTIMGFVGVGALRVGSFPPVDQLHPVQRGPVGGHRLGETRGKLKMPPWNPPAPEPRVLASKPKSITSFTDVKTPRRVVTGFRPDGMTYLARMEEVGESDYAHVLLGAPGEGPLGALYPIWGCDRLPVFLPTDGLAPPYATNPGDAQALEALHRAQVLPPPLGYRAAVAKMVPTKEPGPMTWHDSVEIIFVMHGGLTILHDDGSECVLRAGDTVVQNGTNHAWRNHTKEDAWLGIVSFGAIRYGITPPLENLSALQRGSGNRADEAQLLV